jgi:CheY-like chemotaxis protein
MASIVVIDDDLAMDLLSDSLRFRGHDADRISSAADAILQLDRIISADLVVLDIIMPWPEDQSSRSLTGAGSAGMEVFREIRKRKKDLQVIAYSATQDAAVIQALGDDG